MQHHGAEFGWDTDSDFFRWAVWNALESASKMVDGQEVSGVSVLNSVQVEIWQEQHAMAKFKETIDVIQESISVMNRVGAEKRVIRMLQETLYRVEQLDDPFWKKMWKEEIEAKFGHYIKRARLTGVDLDDEE